MPEIEGSAVPNSLLNPATESLPFGPAEAQCAGPGQNPVIPNSFDGALDLVGALTKEAGMLIETADGQKDAEVEEQKSKTPLSNGCATVVSPLPGEEGIKKMVETHVMAIASLIVKKEFDKLAAGLVARYMPKSLY